MPSSSPQAILLVDGYNVVGTWHRLKQTRDRLGLEEARRELVELLVDYSAYQNFDTQIVFDAQYQDSPSSREVVTANVCVCYTDYKQTADTYIERACSLYRKDMRKFEQRLIVATSDRAQQLTVTGYGAEWMSAQHLLTEVELAELRLHRKQRSQRKGQSSRFLSNSLDPVARQRLARMRFGLGKDQG